MTGINVRYTGCSVIFAVDNVKAFLAWIGGSGIEFAELEGRYEGVNGTSFLVELRHLSAMKPWILGQKSVLLLSTVTWGGRRAAFLKTLATGKRVRLGEFKLVDREEAMESRGYIFDISSGSYYVAGE